MRKIIFGKMKSRGYPMVECPGEVFISVLLFEFRIKQCCALHGEVLHPLYFQFICKHDSIDRIVNEIVIHSLK